MMQSCASAAKLRRAGPFYDSGTKAMGGSGTPPPRIVIGTVSPESGRTELGVSWLLLWSLIPVLAGDFHRMKPHALRHRAVVDQLPERHQELARQRHDHDLARVTPAIGRARTVPFDESALRLVPEHPPGELDEPATDAPIARLGKPLLAPFL